MIVKSRPRILVVTRNLPPLVGGMERLNWHIADELSRHAEVWIIGPIGSTAASPAQVCLTEVPLRPLWRFLATSALQAMQVAHRFKPDIVLAGSGLTAPAALMAARVAKARACVYLHGLDAAIQHPVYRTFWHPALRRMDSVITNSTPTARLAASLGIKPSNLSIVYPGVRIPDAAQTTLDKQYFRHRHGLGKGRILLSVGRLTTRKGLLEFVQQALPGIVRAFPDVKLAIVGDAPSDSLHATIQTQESIQRAADGLGIGHHLCFLGTITDPTELACAYECATVHVFPVRNIPGDPEGFGMVAIEAAAHGLPTVAFATGGIVNAVSNDLSGKIVEPGDYDALTDAVIQVMMEKKITWEAGSRAFADSFAWPKFGAQLSKALQLNIPIGLPGSTQR